jgi:hypothetical protein
LAAFCASSCFAVTGFLIFEGSERGAMGAIRDASGWTVFIVDIVCVMESLGILEA